MSVISQLANNKKAWLLLALSAIALELTALVFQYFMDLAPCIMCVYQRLAIFAIALAGLIGAYGKQHFITRGLAFSLWGIGAIWGLIIALEHVEMQNAAFSLFATCDIVPNFPTWAPLHQWLPFLFEATGDCGDINWQFLGYSMPQWMILVYALYTLLFGLVLASRIIKVKNI
ncbi:MAG: disulfide bond formation protein DsbB [Thalassotalea sp.]